MKRNFLFLFSNSIKFAKSFVLPALLILLSAASFQAQNFERGKSAELKGLTKLYINVGTDIERRDLIANEIEEAKIPGLVLVNSRKEAEIIIRFGGMETEVLQDITTNPVLGTDWTLTTIDRRVVRSGQGLVFIAGKEGKSPRIVMIFESVQDNAFEKRPAIKFAKKFISAYKEANSFE